MKKKILLVSLSSAELEIGIPHSKGHPSLVAEVPSMVNDKHFQVGFLPSFLPSQVSGKALGMGDSCHSY